MSDQLALWRKNSKAHYWRHRDRIRARKKELLKQHPRDYFKNDLRRHCGITPQKYKELCDAQNNLCALCGKPERALANHGKRVRGLCVDHCHETGILRGLLCSSCNIGIGNLKHDPELLRRAIEYLEKYRA